MSQEIDEHNHEVSLPTREHASSAVHYQYQQPMFHSNIYYLNKITLAILLVVSAIISAALDPLIKAGIRRAAEIYLDIPPNGADYYRFQRRGLELDKQTQSTTTSSSSSYTPLNTSAKSNNHNSHSNEHVCRHSYQMYILNRDPLVVYLEGFLQPGEADHMIELAKPRMERSRIIGDDIYSEDRTSSSAYIEQSEDDIVRCIEERASRITNIPVESTEPLQVVWYTKGQEFRPHVDFLLPEDFQHLNKPKEHKGKHSRTTREMDQRYTTFLVYLNEPTEGGGTLFTELDMEILPKKNDAVLWYNMDINDVGDDRTMHGGLPVEAGEKYAINIWQCKQIPYMTSHFEDVSSTNSRYEEEVAFIDN